MYSMSESEVIERFCANMTGNLIGMTRAKANAHMREIMAKSQNRLASHSVGSIVSRFALRAEACYFIIR